MWEKYWGTDDKVQWAITEPKTKAGIRDILINRAIDTITRWCNKEEEQKAQEENRKPIIIPHFSCHVFRHTFCTRFCENVTNIKVIQEIMGHANISITMDIYAKATEEKKKQALDELSKNLKIF